MLACWSSSIRAIASGSEAEKICGSRVKGLTTLRFCYLVFYKRAIAELEEILLGDHAIASHIFLPRVTGEKLA